MLRFPGAVSLSATHTHGRTHQLKCKEPGLCHHQKIQFGQNLNLTSITKHHKSLVDSMGISCLLPIAVSGDDKALIFAVLLWAWNWTEDGWKRRKRENREAEKSCVEKGERKYRLPSYKAKLLMRWCPPNLKSMLQIIRVVLHTE